MDSQTPGLPRRSRARRHRLPRRPEPYPLRLLRALPLPQPARQRKSPGRLCDRPSLPRLGHSEEKYYLMLENCVLKTAKMIAQWQSVGFNHGVMNTDNMSILGDTIDYGPFGFLDNYDPEHICNHSDTNGRYSFKNQPSIGLWNLNALATALTSLIDNQDLVRALKQYEPEFLNQFRHIMARQDWARRIPARR